MATKVHGGGAGGTGREASARAAAVVFPPPRSPRSRRWRASCRPRPAGRCRAGRRLSWPAKRSRAGSSVGLGHDGLAVAGGGRDPAVGVALVGVPARPGLPRRRPAACSISTSAAGRAGGCTPATTSSAPTRRPSCRRCSRRHPLVAPGPGRPGLVEHEYRRRGTLAYLAAMDVHDPARGLFGRCEQKISNQAFDALVADVMTSEPYASAQRVFWVVDNGTIHRGQKAIDAPPGRLAEPRARPSPAPRLVAQPDRDLLLDPRPQGPDPGALQRPRRTRRPRPRLPSTSSPRPPGRSTGPSPATTSTPSSTASITAADSRPAA